MNQNDENGGRFRLVPGTGSGTEQMEAPFRRLIEFDFTCPLCGEGHLASFYYSQEAATLEEYLEGLHAFAGDWNSVQRVLSDAVIEIHDGRNDLEDLTERAGRDGLIPTPPPGYRVIDERLYTCDDCGAEFQAMRELREHAARGC